MEGVEEGETGLTPLRGKVTEQRNNQRGDGDGGDGDAEETVTE